VTLGGVVLILGAAFARNSSGMVRFVPQNVQAMRAAPGMAWFGPPQAGQGMVLSVILMGSMMGWVGTGASSLAQSVPELASRSQQKKTPRVYGALFVGSGF
jgi:hypothetical protein